jgi:TatD-related deoxyribonuclease
MHLRRDGRFIDAIKEFKQAGGTHFVLCQYPMTSILINEKSYRSCYLETIKMADEIKAKLNIGVFVTIGPYPVDFIRLIEKFERESAINIMKKGIDEAANFCQEGLCIAIGEIGRPHFPVSNQIISDSNDILFYGMQTTPKNCQELVEMGKKAGLKPGKIVKHFSPSLILKSENYGLMPSVLASEKNIISSIKKGTRFLLETDYIDDPKRPGAVLGPKTVPKKTLSLLKQEILNEDQILKIHKENPEKTYNICLDG